MDKPIKPEVLSNPNHKITKHLIYLYTMESFIYPGLNKACRDKDVQMIRYFGPLASVLGYIIHSANHNQSKDCRLEGERTLYRGIKLLQSEINSFNVDEVYALTGF